MTNLSVNELNHRLVKAGEELVASHRNTAKVYREAYEAYRAEGFSDEQAFCILIALNDRSFRKGHMNRADRRAAGKRGPA
jgi:hypothetical protein